MHQLLENLTIFFHIFLIQSSKLALPIFRNSPVNFHKNENNEIHHCIETMNNNANDDGVISDSSTDRESNAAANNSYAKEDCAPLLQDNERSSDIILRRIVHYTDGSSRFQAKYQDNDDNDDENRPVGYRFDVVSLRQSHKKSMKRFLFLFGFASSLIVLSQLFLLFYYDDPSVQGVSQFICNFFSWDC